MLVLTIQGMVSISLITVAIPTIMVSRRYITERTIIQKRIGAALRETVTIPLISPVYKALTKATTPSIARKIIANRNATTSVILIRRSCQPPQRRLLEAVNYIVLCTFVNLLEQRLQSSSGEFLVFRARHFGRVVHHHDDHLIRVERPANEQLGGMPLIGR